MSDSTGSGPSVEQIMGWAEQRKRAQGPNIARMRKIKDAVNGEIVIPLPELATIEDPSTPNIIQTGLDQYAGRIASVLPNPFYPPVRFGIDKSEAMARTRTLATQGWWEMNRLDLKMKRRARQYSAYGYSPVLLTPHSKWEIARWQYRDPLNTFPAMTDDPDEITPPDCIFRTRQSWGWLKEHYADRLTGLNTGGVTPDRNKMFDLIQYVDADVYVTAVLGAEADSWQSQQRGAPFVEVERTANRAGVCTAVTAGRITLDKRLGQFDGAIGMYKTQAELMALELINARNAVFPAMYIEQVIGTLNSGSPFIAGPYEGISGQVNVLTPGASMREAFPPANQAIEAISNRLERGQRLAGGVSPDMGGESQSNVRTGKRGDSIMQAVIEHPIAEAQLVFQHSLQEETKRAIAIVKAYWGKNKKSFYVPSAKEYAVYTPDVDFENDNIIVSYPMMGVDVNGLVIQVGQLRGLGAMSAHTAMELLPQISDPVFEKRRVDAESLEQAVLQGVQQQIAAGAIAPHDGATMIKYRLQGMSVAEAVTKVHEEAQARQATQAPAPEPGMATDPSQQTGIAQPGVGAEQAPPDQTVAGPSGSTQNLSDLLNAMRRPQRESASEKGLPIGAPGPVA